MGVCAELRERSQGCHGELESACQRGRGDWEGWVQRWGCPEWALGLGVPCSLARARVDAGAQLGALSLDGQTLPLRGHSAARA